MTRKYLKNLQKLVSVVSLRATSDEDTMSNNR